MFSKLNSYSDKYFNIDLVDYFDLKLAGTINKAHILLLYNTNFLFTSLTITATITFSKFIVIVVTMTKYNIIHMCMDNTILLSYTLSIFNG